MSVNMTKGQRISLEKQGGGELTKVRMGLGWDAITKKGLFGRKKAGKDIDVIQGRVRPGSRSANGARSRRT